MNICERYIDDIWDAADGSELAPEVAQHVATCARCTAEFRRANAAARGFAALAATEVDVPIPVLPVAPVPRRWIFAVPVGAGVIAVLALVLMLRPVPPPAVHHVVAVKPAVQPSPDVVLPVPRVAMAEEPAPKVRTRQTPRAVTRHHVYSVPQQVANREPATPAAQTVALVRIMGSGEPDVATTIVHEGGLQSVLLADAPPPVHIEVVTPVEELRIASAGPDMLLHIY